MRKFISILLAVAMTVTMPGTFQFAETADVQAAEVSASGDFTSGNFTGYNMEFVDDSNSDNESYTYSTSRGGVTARHMDNNKYAYFKIANDAITQNDNNLFVEITYYDEGSDGFQLQYNAAENNNYKQATINTSNSQTWVTTTVCLDDASFRKAQNGKCDFRIWGRGSKGTTISKISITKQSVNPSGEPTVTLSRDTSISEFRGKTFTGYQGWFGTGGQYNSWQHYAYGSADADGTSWPRANKISIDYFPDVTEYGEGSLAQTGFADLGNGTATKLFDSNAKDVIDTHFQWMKEYGIDGAAIQRFVGGLSGRTITRTPEATQLSKIQNAAEANNRLLYVMYDISGGTQISDANDTTSISSYVKDMEFDWVYNIEQSLKMLDSSSYATVNGKPVVCVWGFGFSNSENTRPSRRADYQEIVNFFHNRGCYVILGLPREWRNQSQYIDIYNQADMISPWYVGGLGADEASVDSLYSNYLSPDISYCNNNGIDYYPVVFSGFSWALWQGGKPNMIPRNAGQTLWNQVYKLKQKGINSFYLAMFDEYDEGTAVAKNASDYFDIPTDQYFVTASCDGYWLSSDFQLRVAGEAIKMIKGERDLVKNVPVEHSLGPVYYRNSFESKYVTCADTQYNGYYPVDPCFNKDKQIAAGNANGTTQILKDTTAKSGEYLASISGSANAENSSYIYQISETAIKIKKGMRLSYSVFAVNELGKNTYIELICNDGTYISTQNITNNGVNMSSSSPKGEVGKWTDYSFTFGSEALEGKSITGIALCYGGAAGNYKAYYDDIIIEEGETVSESDTVYAGNPIITNMFTADPSAHVWADGRIYIYASHDIFPSKGCDLMDKYHVFSSDNMVTWRDEGEILSSDDVSWGRPEGGFMWAPDAAYENGNYYFYFPHPTGAGDEWNNTWRIGIATSKSPAGGFTCADDGYVKKADGTPYITGIDPCIFKDDDGQYYLYTGGGAQCYVAKMSKDMMTLAEEPVRIDETLTDFHEAMWVFKKDGIYYAMYADNTEGENIMRYSTASSPYGPWKAGGVVLEGTGCDTTHGSIAEYKGHWYLFYHNCEISGNGTLRSVCIDELHFNTDGSIQTVMQTKKGVAAVDVVDPSESSSNSGSPDASKFTEKTDYSIEEVTIGGGATKSSAAVENLHQTDSYVEWSNIDGGKGGQAMLTVYYGTPDGATSLVNSSGDVAGDGYFLKFDKTSSWSDYSGVATCFIDLNAGTNNTVRLTCGMGGVNITGISISLPDQAMEQPTEAPTTTQTDDRPEEVFGIVVNSDTADSITVVWGRNSIMEEKGQTYNVYIDGEKKLSNVECAAYTINGISAGQHTVNVTAVLNGSESSGQSVTVTVKRENTASNASIEINGFQISTTIGGFRTVYSVDDPENEVVGIGMVYGLSDSVSESDMVVNSQSDKVFDYVATDAGKISSALTEKESVQSYAMTIRFNIQNKAAFFDTRICVRAYAKLSDGSYIYSDCSHTTVYNVADYLYKNLRMNSIQAHNYLYDNILKLVTPDYKAVEFDWNPSIVAPDKI